MGPGVRYSVPMSEMVYSTMSGVETSDVCPEVEEWGEHVMSEIEADLAGGVTIGYCVCGEYMRNEGI